MVDFSFNAVHVSYGPTERVERRKKEKKIDEKKNQHDAEHDAFIVRTLLHN